MNFLSSVIFSVAVALSTGDAATVRSSDLPLVLSFEDEHGRLRPTLMIGDAIPNPKINEKEDVLFFVHKRVSSVQVYVDDPASIHTSALNPKLPTYIITHGFLSSSSSDTIEAIRDMYLGREECNVIAVDWSALAHDIVYPIAKANTVPVGKYVARFVDFIADTVKLDVSKLHMAGHSLGSHIMGIAGKNIKSGKVGRITGMDPAGPLYSIDDIEDRLAVGDAYFVDAIHTCAGLFGFDGSIADADFFPNGGHPEQPGCSGVLGGVCSHSRSWEFFAESITSKGFAAVSCTSYEDYSNGLCDGNPKVPMGDPTPSSARGSYYLKTASESPFALG